jgi:hypothetical protein
MNLKQERFFTGVFLFCICLQLAQSMHTAWFSLAATLAHSPSEGVLKVFAQPTTPYAPQAYRVPIPALIRFVAGAFHIHDPTYVAAAFDLVVGFLSLYLFYLLTVNLLPENTTTPKDRALTILFFLAMIQFPLAWVVPSQRPETLPSALYLAVSLFSLANIKTNTRWFLLVLVAALCQAFVRADVPFVFGIAVILVGLWSGFKQGFEASRRQIVAGSLVVLISGSIQAYLQFIRYPHLSYPPDTRVIQLPLNLVPHRLGVFTIALLPFLLFFIFLIIKRAALTALDKVVIVSSALYLPAWFTVGFVSEVRIYVPFLLALSMVVARVSATFLSSEAHANN